MKKLSLVLIAALGLTAQATASDLIAELDGQSARRFEVTITNVTKGQSFTPIVAATHNRSIAFFELGAEASGRLAALAEGGDIAPMVLALEAANKVVADVSTTDGLLEPGQSVTLKISSRGNKALLSFAAMLIPTNDTFVALDSARLPTHGVQTFFARAYDAGSEPNDEDCSNIPGPVCGGTGGSPDAGGEGFVHISSGIHGIGSLGPERYDWRDAVAKVVVERVR